MTRFLGKSILVLIVMLLIGITLGVATINLILLIKLSKVALPILLSI